MKIIQRAIISTSNGGFVQCILEDGSIWAYWPETKEWKKLEESTGELESSLKEHIKNHGEDELEKN